MIVLRKTVDLHTTRWWPAAVVPRLFTELDPNSRRKIGQHSQHSAGTHTLPAVRYWMHGYCQHHRYYRNSCNRPGLGHRLLFFEDLYPQLSNRRQYWDLQWCILLSRGQCKYPTRRPWLPYPYRWIDQRQCPFEVLHRWYHSATAIFNTGREHGVRRFRRPLRSLQLHWSGHWDRYQSKEDSDQLCH